VGIVVKISWSWSGEIGYGGHGIITRGKTERKGGKETRWWEKVEKTNED